MSDSQIDRLPITQLLSRYSISKPALYSRINALEIQTTRVGRKSYVSAPQLQRLDQLDQYLSEGGTIAEFVKQHGKQSTEQLSEQLSEQSPKDSEQLAPASQPGWVTVLPAVVEGFVPALADAISTRLTPIMEGITAKLAPPLSPLAELEALERAYEKRWILSTSQLASVLKLSPKTLVSSQSFERHGFIFTRAGKVGAEIGWKVGKNSTE